MKNDLTVIEDISRFQRKQELSMDRMRGVVLAMELNTHSDMRKAWLRSTNCTILELEKIRDELLDSFKAPDFSMEDL